MKKQLTEGLEKFDNSAETSKMRSTTSLGELKEEEEKNGRLVVLGTNHSRKNLESNAISAFLTASFFFAQ